MIPVFLWITLPGFLPASSCVSLRTTCIQRNNLAVLLVMPSLRLLGQCSAHVCSKPNGRRLFIKREAHVEMARDTARLAPSSPGSPGFLIQESKSIREGFETRMPNRFSQGSLYDYLLLSKGATHRSSSHFTRVKAQIISFSVDRSAFDETTLFRAASSCERRVRVSCAPCAFGLMTRAQCVRSVLAVPCCAIMVALY